MCRARFSGTFRSTRIRSETAMFNMNMLVTVCIFLFRMITQQTKMLDMNEARTRIPNDTSRKAWEGSEEENARGWFFREVSLKRRIRVALSVSLRNLSNSSITGSVILNNSSPSATSSPEWTWEWVMRGEKNGLESEWPTSSDPNYRIRWQSQIFFLGLMFIFFSNSLYHISKARLFSSRQLNESPDWLNRFRLYHCNSA